MVQLLISTFVNNGFFHPQDFKLPDSLNVEPDFRGDQVRMLLTTTDKPHCPLTSSILYHLYSMLGDFPIVCTFEYFMGASWLIPPDPQNPMSYFFLSPWKNLASFLANRQNQPLAKVMTHGSASVYHVHVSRPVGGRRGGVILAMSGSRISSFMREYLRALPETPERPNLYIHQPDETFEKGTWFSEVNYDREYGTVVVDGYFRERPDLSRLQCQTLFFVENQHVPGSLQELYNIFGLDRQLGPFDHGLLALGFGCQCVYRLVTPSLVLQDMGFLIAPRKPVFRINIHLEDKMWSQLLVTAQYIHQSGSPEKKRQFLSHLVLMEAGVLPKNRAVEKLIRFLGRRVGNEPYVPFEVKRRPALTRTPDNCSICISPPVFPVRNDVCDHEFCYECLWEWNLEKSSCPLCNREFRPLFWGTPQRGDLPSKFTMCPEKYSKLMEILCVHILEGRKVLLFSHWSDVLRDVEKLFNIKDSHCITGREVLPQTFPHQLTFCSTRFMRALRYSSEFDVVVLLDTDMSFFSMQLLTEYFNRAEKIFCSPEASVMCAVLETFLGRPNTTFDSEVVLLRYLQLLIG